MIKLILSFVFLSTLVWAQVPRKTMEIPKREVAIILTKEGYYPKSVTVFEGEKVKFYLTSTIEEPGCMIVQGHEVFLAAQKGKVTEAEVEFKNPGDFAFYCPSQRQLDGKLTVLKKMVKPSPSRALAGEVVNDPNLWTPKEY